MCIITLRPAKSYAGYNKSMEERDVIAAKLAALQRSRFRSSFNLKPADRLMVQQKGLPTIRRHGAELLEQRLFTANPTNDGRQTPYRGHPVFVAQHATATCCRSCLARWHGIVKGQALTPAQREYVLGVIMAWIARQAAV